MSHRHCLKCANTKKFLNMLHNLIQFFDLDKDRTERHNPFCTIKDLSSKNVKLKYHHGDFVRHIGEKFLTAYI